MKSALIPLALVAVVLGLSACGEKKDTATLPSTAPSAETKPMADVIDKATVTAKDAVPQPTAAVSDAAAKVMAQAKEALGKAQELVGQGKFQEAQDSLKSIADLKLAPEQQQLLDGLKAKIQQGLAAAKAVGGGAVKSLPGIPKP